MCIEYNQLCPETCTWKSKRNQAPNEVSDCSTGDKDFWFCNRKRNPKTDFTSNKSVLMVDFDYEIQIWILWISFLPFDWEIRKRICKSILVNSGLLFANYACACKTAVFQILFGFPKKKEKRKGMKEQISPRWNPFSDFAFDCKSEILILKSKTKFPNQTHSSSIFYLCWFGTLSSPPLPTNVHHLCCKFPRCQTWHLLGSVFHR